MKDLIIPVSTLRIQFKETEEAFDKEPNLRAYCTQSPHLFNVQIRGTVPLFTNKNLYRKDVKPRNLIATISLTSEEILQLAELVKREKEWYGCPSLGTEEKKQEEHEKFLAENFEENGDPKEMFQ